MRLTTQFSKFMGLFNQSNIFQLNQLQEGRHVREKIFQLIYILESYPRDESSMQRIVHATNCPCDELSMRRIVRDELSATNCPCDELSGRPIPSNTCGMNSNGRMKNEQPKNEKGLLRVWHSIGKDVTKKLVPSIPSRLNEVIRLKGYPTGY